MKRFMFVFAGVFLLVQGMFSAVVKGSPELTVSVKPDKLVIKEFGEWVPGTYIFKNTSKEVIEFGFRNAVFVSSDGQWTSFNIGPLKTKITIEPGQTYTFDDNILVPFEIVLEMYNLGKLKSGDFTFIQNFNYDYGDKTGTVSVKWDVKMTETPEKLGYIITNTAYCTVVTKKEYFPSEYSLKNLKKFLAYSDTAAQEIEKMLGFKPSGKIINLRIGKYDNYYYVASAFFDAGQYNPPYLFFSTDLIAYPSEWIYLSCPEKLVNIFLTYEFGFPPLWMYHGQISYFADKVCANLGYSQIAQDDSFKLIQMGDKYFKSGKTYLFTDKWEMDNPGDKPLAVGRSYQLLGEIEKLCGADIFKKLFSKWKNDGFKFSKELNSLEKTAIVIADLEKLSGKDVMELFKSYGYVPEK